MCEGSVHRAVGLVVLLPLMRLQIALTLPASTADPRSASSATPPSIAYRSFGSHSSLLSSACASDQRSASVLAGQAMNTATGGIS